MIFCAKICRLLKRSKLNVFKMSNLQSFEVIVVGGGHAGVEAALASARMGCRTLLLTHNIETIGQMSCNPAIGGIGKTHLVKEIDALGGAMAQATDLAGIQFRTLNARKGAAVRATRAQTDRVLYKSAIRKLVENQNNLWLFQQAVDDLMVKNDTVTGVITQMGLSFEAPNVILTTGTFLGGKIHIGMSHYRAGRAGDPPATRLAQRLRELPFRVGRLKTGTPPRIDGRSIDYSQLTEQPGDQPLPTMSYLGTVEQHPKQVSCYITETNSQTHEMIREGLQDSPLYSGMIEGVGPRYCPSIEDKVVRFADRDKHQIFLEPEGLNTNEVYPNGISTSLPFELQQRFVQSIKGLKHCHILRPGYAIEYDFFDPRDLQASLETRLIKGLFFAGQINGTTGYEEAAAQGLIAGINAALKIKGKDSWTPKRHESYIGVLIDDLITCGTKEPYRMFTSRAEYRLLLRQDNADLRLTEIGYQLGCVSEVRWQTFCSKKALVQQERQRLEKIWVQASSCEALRFKTRFNQTLEHEYSAMDLLKRPEVNYSQLMDCLAQAENLPATITEQVEIQAKYAGYLSRQEQEIERQSRYETTVIPETLDYQSVHGLSNEVLQKLSDVRPATIAQAARIPGITPAAISLLLVHLNR